MSKRSIPSGTLTIDGVAEVWGVSKRTAQRRMEELNIEPIPSIRKTPVIWLEAKIRALLPDLQTEPKERSPRKRKDLDASGVVKLSTLKKISRSARAGKGGAK